MAGADRILDVFAAEVGPTDPIVAVGGRTQWNVGGRTHPGARQVRAPAGIVTHEPAEMIVRVRAGTPVAEIDAALAEHGQMVPLDPADPHRATVGGVLAVGHSGLRRLRYGPLRDTVLEVRYVSAEGKLVKGGGPVVKNVSGFDIPRLFVGSLGTLGVFAEVVLRAQPLPAVARWLRGDGADPFAVRRRLFRPSSILWDGDSTWVLLEGHGSDVDAEAAHLGDGWVEVAGPPPIPDGGRVSRRPSELRDCSGSFVAEIGVGLVHTESVPAPLRSVPAETAALHHRVKSQFDPAGRMNPGRMVA